MKTSLILQFFFLSFFFLGQSQSGFAQYDSIYSSKQYVVIKNDGTEFIGQILTQDAREVLIKTLKLGEVVIPKHEIREIIELKPKDLDRAGNYISEEVFSTRYFFSTNGLSMKKGEGYVKWGLYGPEIQYVVADNLTLGLITSWLAIPLIGTAKYSFELGESVSFGVGTMLGTGSWVSPDFGLALPFGSVTVGDHKKNLTFSGGYGFIFGSGVSGEGTGLLSVAGMVKGGGKISFVFDSYIVPNLADGYGFAVLIPGLRFQTDVNKAFQFGLAGAVANRSTAPIPFPMLQWYRKI